MSAQAPTLRLFIAVKLPEMLHTALMTLQERVERLDPQHMIRWVANDSLHLTLKFLGDAPADQVEAILGAMQAASDTSPFTLRLEQIGAFPNLRAPRVVWLGVAGEMAALHQLRDAVERTVSPLGFPTEARPFSPHLTLGRARPYADKAAVAAVGEALSKLTVEPMEAWQITEFVLMRSDTHPEGAVYTVVGRVALS